MTTINLRIEHLVLDGVGPESRDGPRLRAAIEGELARLLGEEEHEWRPRLAPVLRGEALPAAEVGPDQLGAQVGAAIHASLAP